MKGGHPLGDELRDDYRARLKEPTRLLGASLDNTSAVLLVAVEYKGGPVTFPPTLDVNDWPCDFGCGHGHYPGTRCGHNGCECRA